jgi:hypothetical protein
LLRPDRIFIELGAKCWKSSDTIRPGRHLRHRHAATAALQLAPRVFL